MFEKAAEKLRNWLGNPEWAPLTRPLKTIGGAAYVPISGMVECVRNGLNPESYSRDRDKPAIVRIYKEFGDVDRIMPLLVAWVGGIGGAITGSIMAGAIVASAGAGIPLIAAASAAALGVSFIATPILVAGALAFAGATVGALCSPASFVKGCMERHKYHATLKAQGAVAQAVPALQSQDADAKQTAAEIFSKLRDLPVDVQGPVMRALNDRYAVKGGTEDQRILQAIDAMPPDARTALLKGLKDRLAPEFAAAAEKEAGDSVVLQKGITVDGPLKLKIPASARA